MPRLDYLHLDVFTNRQFEGNQLAVYWDGRGLDTATMQRIAREMNFSETTFILPPERNDTDVRMRIFTPGAELPMAGHPTIGSTFALAHLGTIARGRESFVFGLGVGPTRVELSWENDALSFAWMDQRPPETRQPVVSSELVARAAGADHAAFSRTGLPIQEITCGVPYVLLPLATRADVDAAEPDVASLRALKSAFDSDHIGLLVFTTEATEPGVTAYSRMFAPGLGVPEDPATGSAAGPLGCYLVSHGLVKGDASTQHDQLARREDGTAEPNSHRDHERCRWTDHASASGRTVSAGRARDADSVGSRVRAASPRCRFGRFAACRCSAVRACAGASPLKPPRPPNGGLPTGAKRRTCSARERANPRTFRAPGARASTRHRPGAYKAADRASVRRGLARTPSARESPGSRPTRVGRARCRRIAP